MQRATMQNWKFWIRNAKQYQNNNDKKQNHLFLWIPDLFRDQKLVLRICLHAFLFASTYVVAYNFCS